MTEPLLRNAFFFKFLSSLFAGQPCGSCYCSGSNLTVNQSVLQCTLVNQCLVLFGKSACWSECLVLFGKSVDLVLFGESECLVLFGELECSLMNESVEC